MCQSLEVPFISIGRPVLLLIILLPLIVIRAALSKEILAPDTLRFVPSMTFPLTSMSLLLPAPAIAEPSHCLITLPVIVWREVPEESRKIPTPRLSFPERSVTDLTPAIMFPVMVAPSDPAWQGWAPLWPSNIMIPLPIACSTEHPTMEPPVPRIWNPTTSTSFGKRLGSIWAAGTPPIATQPTKLTFSAGSCVSKCAVSDATEVQLEIIMLRCTPLARGPLLPPVVTAWRVCAKRQPLMLMPCEADPTTIP